METKFARRLAHLGIVLCATLCGCMEQMKGLPIRLVIPVGFSGHITIIEDKDSLDLRYGDEGYICRIPTKGTLRVGSLKPWRLFHEEKAFLTSGQPLAKLQIGDPGPAWEIAVYSLANPGDRIEYFVGTRGMVFEYITNHPAYTDAGLWLSGKWPSNKPPPDDIKRMMVTNRSTHGNNK